MSNLRWLSEGGNIVTKHYLNGILVDIVRREKHKGKFKLIAYKVIT